MHNKKILFIINVDWFFVSHRLPIALAALKKGFEVHVACAITDKKSLLEAEGLIVHELLLSRSGTAILNELISIRDIYRIVKCVKPSVIHSVTIKPVIYGNIMGRILGTPIRVSSISGLGYVFIAKGLKAKLFRLFVSTMYRVALRQSKAVIFQNTADRDVLRRMKAVTPNQEVLIRGSGVALEKYIVLEEPEGNPVVMFIARLLIDKGVEEFVEASEAVKLIRPNVRMVLVGDIDLGNPKSIKPDQLAAWVASGNVEYWGYSNKISETISKSHLVVLPSYREGLPKVLLEAAASGRAVITTDVPGCRDAIIPNCTGLLVPVREITPLVNAILKLLNDDVLRRGFGLQGRMLAENEFDIEDVISTHLSIYGV
ncbi:glycosyltransferase family 4 protein [Neptuniibacter sp. 2_MG-2023]|uniref:glycosyltransferase family 4 protein n=1 Tax=Neptuniibacter sp. 2_MG-2023 TaxID=3062671 RepID=UPI0026E29DCC|nr:glycosyltransferase family 4 protein [Neptuniibacter sp. 2_MG-2023]MDO6515535.1 glycosyltransferase family 4 protein [Neptuniibacter sp. 2_MG-2023]